MKFYHLTLLSKNKNSLGNSFLFLNKSIFSFIIVKKYFNKQRKCKKLTILKSPHVNKTAQEQFEIRFFSRQFNICLIRSLKYLIIYKRIKNILFPDIFIKTQFSFNKRIENRLKFKIFNPNNFKITKIPYRNRSIRSKNLKKIKHFIKIFDIYGELKNFTYNLMFR